MGPAHLRLRPVSRGAMRRTLELEMRQSSEQSSIEVERVASRIARAALAPYRVHAWLELSSGCAPFVGCARFAALPPGDARRSPAVCRSEAPVVIAIKIIATTIIATMDRPAMGAVSQTMSRDTTCRVAGAPRADPLAGLGGWADALAARDGRGRARIRGVPCCGTTSMRIRVNTLPRKGAGRTKRAGRSRASGVIWRGPRR